MRVLLLVFRETLHLLVESCLDSPRVFRLLEDEVYPNRKKESSSQMTVLNFTQTLPTVDL